MNNPEKGRWNNFSLGKAIGTSHVTVGKWLDGSEPGIGWARKLAELFGVSIDWLAGRGEEEETMELRDRPPRRQNSTEAEVELEELQKGLEALLSSSRERRQRRLSSGDVLKDREMEQALRKAEGGGKGSP